MEDIVGVGGEARQDSKMEASEQPSPYPAGSGWKSLGGLQLAIGRLQLTPSSVLFLLYK